jgi:putative tryptophan/tyrosine transport system substrate-binding protein
MRANGDAMKTVITPRLLGPSMLVLSRNRSRRRFMQAGARIGAQAVVFLAVPGMWRVSAHGQTPAQVTRIAFLSAGPRPDQPGPWLRAFQEGLRELGWVESETFAIESRFAEGKFERIPEIVAELVRLNVKAITAIGSPVAAIAKRETTLPIVMIGDPVGTRLAATLERPGGTVTGLASNSQAICGKRLRFLKTVAPTLTRLAFIAKPDNPAIPGILRMTRIVADELGIELIPVDVQTEKDMEQAFETMIKAEARAFIFGSSGNSVGRRPRSGDSGRGRFLAGSS